MDADGVMKILAPATAKEVSLWLCKNDIERSGPKMLTSKLLLLFAYPPHRAEWQYQQCNANEYIGWFIGFYWRDEC